MKKVILFAMIAMIGLTFGRQRANNWVPYNFTAGTTPITVTLNYTRSGFTVRNISGVTLNVAITKFGVTATDNILPNCTKNDYYPLSFSTLSTDSFKISAASNTSVYVEQYEVNE